MAAMRPSATQAFQAQTLVPWVQELTRGLNEQIQRSLQLSLDGSPTSLAFVDHYLSLARQEDRPQILSLLAAQAGAYFGQILCEQVGAFWLGDGQNPRTLRIFIEPHFLYLAPVDLAYQAIVSQTLEEDDPRYPEGGHLDTAFHLRTQPDPRSPKETRSDEDWVQERLAQSPPIPEQEYFSLTGRFETLEFILELLAARCAHLQLDPQKLGPSDYLQALDPSAS